MRPLLSTHPTHLTSTPHGSYAVVSCKMAQPATLAAKSHILLWLFGFGGLEESNGKRLFIYHIVNRLLRCALYAVPTQRDWTSMWCNGVRTSSTH